MRLLKSNYKSHNLSRVVECHVWENGTWFRDSPTPRPFCGHMKSWRNDVLNKYSPTSGKNKSREKSCCAYVPGSVAILFYINSTWSLTTSVTVHRKSTEDLTRASDLIGSDGTGLTLFLIYSRPRGKLKSGTENTSLPKFTGLRNLGDSIVLYLPLTFVVPFSISLHELLKIK